MTKSVLGLADIQLPFSFADRMRDLIRENWVVNIRKFVVKADHLEDLIRLGTLTRAASGP